MLNTRLDIADEGAVESFLDSVLPRCSTEQRDNAAHFVAPPDSFQFEILRFSARAACVVAKGECFGRKPSLRRHSNKRV